MTLTAPTRRPPVTLRRAGFVLAVAADAILLYAANAWPGWQALTFLTEDTGRVLGLVNLSLIVGLVVNLTYLGYDAPWWRALGELATAGIGLVVAVRIWQVFPFAFRDAWFDAAVWSWLVRFLLIVAMVGSAVGVVVQAVSLLRRVVEGGSARAR